MLATFKGILQKIAIRYIKTLTVWTILLDLTICPRSPDPFHIIACEKRISENDKTANTKTAKTKERIYKTAKIQNSQWYKTAKIHKNEYCKAAKITKQRMVQNSKYYKTAQITKLRKYKIGNYLFLTAQVRFVMLGNGQRPRDELIWVVKGRVLALMR